jgi:hypothetical protein
VVLGVAAAMMWLVTGNPREGSLFKRQFIPGALGQERGRGNALTARAFTTRALWGVSSTDDWARTNHLNEPLAFSHAMGQLFPPELYASHPEYFPWVDAARYQPAPGSYHWQPDIARNDVAVHVAQAATTYFDAHPRAESFSAGVNDGLLFGESPELLALLRSAFTGGNGGNGAETPVKADQSVSTGGMPRSDRARLAAAKAGEQEEAERTEDVRSANTSSGLGSTPVKTDRPVPHWFRHRPDYSNLVFTFTNRVAEHVAREHPGKYVGALAYYWCENAECRAVSHRGSRAVLRSHLQARGIRFAGALGTGAGDAEHQTFNVQHRTLNPSDLFRPRIDSCKTKSIQWHRRNTESGRRWPGKNQCG